MTKRDEQLNIELYCLRQAYERLIRILDTTIDCEALVDDDKIDSIYINLHQFISNTMNSVKERGIMLAPPPVYIDFTRLLKIIQKEWPSERAEMISFCSSIKSKRISLFGIDVQPPEDFEKLMDTTDNEITRYESLCRKSEKREAVSKTQGPNIQQKLEPASTDSVKPDINNGNEDKVPISSYKLEHTYYSKKDGVLSLSPFNSVRIIKHKSVFKPNSKQKYAECQLMDKLCKSVNTFSRGITFSQATGVHNGKIDEKAIKNLRNYASAINKKVHEGGGPKNLILVRNGHVQINSSYQ